MSNYPPGVTGAEPQITGEDAEWYPCACCDGNGGATHGLLPDHAAQLAALRYALRGIRLDWHAMKHSQDADTCTAGHCGRIRPLLEVVS